jgi:prepilin-type N-terminal cleavage/methylation domain-containing protein
MSGRARQREDGFALTELLVAMTVGLVVLMAAFLLLDRAQSASRELSDRQDAVQRGRQAMEYLTRQIRSQVCLGNTTEPITYASPSQVTFYADLSDGSKNVERRTLSYSAAAKTITEQVFPGIGVYPDLTFAASPTETRTLLTKAEIVTSPSTPFLRYYAFDPGGPPGSLRELPASPSMSATNLPLVVMVKIAVVSLPEGRRPSNTDATTFYNDVYVRLANPTVPTEGPRCL